MGTLHQKLCLNSRGGRGSGDRLTQAAEALEQLTGQAPVFSNARYFLGPFSIRRNEKVPHSPWGLREILGKGLKVHEYELRK